MMDLTAAERTMIRIALDERAARLWDSGAPLLSIRYGQLAKRFEPAAVQLDLLAEVGRVETADEPGGG